MSGEWTISRKMTRQKEQEDYRQEHTTGVGKRESNDKPSDSRQGGGIRHPQPSFGVTQQRKKTIYRENLAGYQSKQNEDQHHLPLKIISVTLNSFTVPGCKMSGLKSAHTHTHTHTPTHIPANTIFSSPITNLLLIVCILMNILALANAKTKT